VRRLLLLEDEARVAAFVQRGLQAEGFAVTHVSRGHEAVERGLSGGFALIVLALMVPDLDGVSVCERLRAGGVSTPVLMLTARDGVQDVVEGLARGADDYLTKPFAFDELVARLNALDRRGGVALPEAREATLRLGGLEMDRLAHEARLDGAPLELSGKEFAVLALLAASPNTVLSRERILSAAWGAHEDPLTNIVDVYVARLRRKLGGSDAAIETVRNVGYKLVLRRGCGAAGSG
jgi:DNA-binding response OmpR family regulator